MSGIVIVVRIFLIRESVLLILLSDGISIGKSIIEVFFHIIRRCVESGVSVVDQLEVEVSKAFLSRIVFVAIPNISQGTLISIEIGRCSLD